MDVNKLLVEIIKGMEFTPLYLEKLKYLNREYGIETILNPNSKKCKQLKIEIEKYKKRHAGTRDV
jgi:hypothetical protein